MAEEDGSEGRAGVGRVEAFSDGVVAIIITIMVLELHPPVSERMAQLWTLWPVFLAYILSYAYVAIYWINHHSLFSHATRSSGALLWSNMLLLFTLSLIPSSTSYLGQQHFSAGATILYLVSLFLPSLAYAWLQRTIERTGRQGQASRDYHRRTARKGAVSSLIYLLGIPLTFISPWLGVACAGFTALLWVLPSGPVERLFGGRESGAGLS